MEKNLIITAGVVLLLLSSFLCLESFINMINLDEQEEPIIQQIKWARTAGDSANIRQYRSMLYNKIRGSDIEARNNFAMLSSGILFGATGLSLLVWKIFYTQKRIQNTIN